MLTQPNVKEALPTGANGDVWAILYDTAATPAAFCGAWLTMQCQLIPGATSGLLLLPGPDGTLLPMARWSGCPQPLDLAKVAGRAVSDQRMTIAWARDSQMPQTQQNGSLVLMVGQPLGPMGGATGAIAVAVTPGRDTRHADPEGVARQLQAGAGWLETLCQRENARHAVVKGEQTRLRLSRAATAMDALAVVGEQTDLVATCMAFVNDMATRLACSRVSLGLVRNGAVKLRATSHTANLKCSGPLIELIEDAMEEAIAQAGPILFPALADDVCSARTGRICVSHKALARTGGSAGVAMSVLVPGNSEWPLAVLTLERRVGLAFDQDDLLLAQVVCDLAGPVLRLQVRSHRWFAGQAEHLVSKYLTRLLGPGRPAVKLCAIAVVLTVAMVAMATGTHRVSGRAVLEGEVQRAAVAPFDGFVFQAPARAGDVVRAGALLASLDDRDLVLEAKKAWAEREKLRQRHQEAVARHDRAATAVAAAQIAQATASLALAEDRQARSRIVAPFDGVVISGDLSQMLGSPVERGKVLFEIAPLNRYRLSVQIEDDNIRWIVPGQSGTLRLAGMPGRLLPFTVMQRTPVATIEDGRNIFKVEGVMSGDPEGLRPGMEGVAKIEIGERNLLWIWMHPLFDAAQLAVWKWQP